MLEINKNTSFSCSGKCKYFPKVSCLREEPKCEDRYNEYNSVCPFHKVYMDDVANNRYKQV